MDSPKTVREYQSEQHEWPETAAVGDASVLPPAFTPWDPEVARDPYPQFADLQERDPVHRFDAVSGWVVTRFDDCADVLRDDRFSSQVHDSTFEKTQHHEFSSPDHAAAIREFFGRSLLFSDGPRHRELRAAARESFSPTALRRFAPALRALVGELVAGLPVDQPFDFVAAYSEVLPLRAVSLLIGIPVEDETELRKLVGGIGSLMDIVKSPAQRDRAADCLVALRERVRDLLAGGRLASGSLAAGLVRGQTRGEIAESDVVGMLSLLLVTGSETTCNLLSAVVYHLGQDREVYAELKAAEGAGVEGFVQEVLRLSPPVVGVARVAREKVRLRGRDIQAGDYVIVALAAANRDPRSGGAGGSSHLSFGHGGHRCLGARVGALQVEMTVQALLDRFDGVEVEPCPELKETQVLRGWRRMSTSFRGQSRRSRRNSS